MKMKTYLAGPLEANNYLVWDEISKEAVLIDCSEYKEEILSDIKTLDLKVKHILLTHGHFDHVMGVNEMAKALGAKVAINQNDIVLLDNINEFGMLFGFSEIDTPKHDILISDNDTFNIGNIQIKAIHTPGHTEGGISYLIENNLFCGDTMFRGTYGRTDLFGGDFKKIIHSIKDVLFKLDDKVKLYPGHGETSDMGYEKKYNDING